MKKLIALSLVLCMMFTLVLPFQTYAQENSGLEQVIKTVKAKINIPDNFSKFDYNLYTNNDKKTWYLSWSTKTPNEGSISITVDDNGTILNYNFYKNTAFDQNKLPKISKQSAQNKAVEFINSIDSNLLSKLKPLEDAQSQLTDNAYQFSYERVENGIPYPENTVSVRVNNNTGEIQDYYYNWTDDLKFPSPDNIISMESAQTAYKEKLGLRLAYNDITEDTNIKVYPVYSPAYLNYYIDAFTGDKIKIQGGYPGPYYGNENRNAAQNIKSTAASPNDIQLTPEELKAAEENSKLISKDDAEKKARSVSILGLDDTFTLINSNLAQDWSFNKNYIWDLNFEKKSEDTSKPSLFTSVALNAQTGEVFRFYISTPYSEEQVGKVDEATAKADVESFLKDFVPDKFNQTEYNDNYSPNVYYPLSSDSKIPTNYNFSYVRKVNGAIFPSNAINVNYDAINQKVSSFDMNWFDVDFPSLNNVKPIDEIYKSLFTNIGLELQYKSSFNEEMNLKYRPIPQPEAAPDIKLVYAIKDTKPQTFDAFTGTILNTDGKPFKENKAPNYTDISDSYAKTQIQVLSDYGVYFEGTEFKPNDNITQKDLLYFMAKGLNVYSPSRYFEDDKDVDEMYNNLTSMGVVKEGEKNPTALVTREDSIKFMLRMLKFNEIADLKGIYVCDFKDADTINPDLIGYVAIAKGLKLINGDNGYFNPKDNLTRAQVAVIVYNYLQR